MLRTAVLCLTVPVALCCGCDRAKPEAVDLAHAIARATPHAAAFSKYETWIVRALSVSSPNADQRALVETLFAPIRNDASVLGVMVAPRRGAHATLSFPGRDRWSDWSTGLVVRHPTLGWVRVSEADPCPTQRPNRRKSEPQLGCVIIARDEDHGHRGTPRLMMAFAQPSSPEAAPRTK